VQARPGVPPQPPPPAYAAQAPPPGYYAPPGAPPPGYSYPQAAPPPASGMSSGTIIAIVVVVVVVLLVVMVPVMYVMTTGLSTPPGTPRPTITLSAGQWSGTSTVISIISVSTGTLAAEALTFQVTAPNGTIYFSGVPGTGTAVNGVRLTITYNDASADGRVGADDNIGLSVAQPSDLQQIHGTTFRVLEGPDVLGTAWLP